MTGVLPAPSYWLGALYLIPTIVEFLVFFVFWRRIGSVPYAARARYKASVLGYLGIICAMTGAVIMLVRWPS